MPPYRDAPRAGRSLRARVVAALRGPSVQPALVVAIFALLGAPWVAIEVHVARPAEVFTGFQRLHAAPFFAITGFTLASLTLDAMGRAVRPGWRASIAHLSSAAATYGAFVVLDFCIMFTLFAPRERRIGGWVALSLVLVSIARSLFLATRPLARSRLSRALGLG